MDAGSLLYDTATGREVEFESLSEQEKQAIIKQWEDKGLNAIGYQVVETLKKRAV